MAASREHSHGSVKSAHEGTATVKRERERERENANLQRSLGARVAGDSRESSEQCTRSGAGEHATHQGVNTDTYIVYTNPDRQTHTRVVILTVTHIHSADECNRTSAEASSGPFLAEVGFVGTPFWTRVDSSEICPGRGRGFVWKSSLGRGGQRPSQ